jgi:putative ABC transport system permease protein
MIFDQEASDRMAAEFKAAHGDSTDDFAPVMIPLADQAGLREYLEMVDYFQYILVLVFVLVMAIVLWNAGLMAGIRRYGEMGIRLAMGESKGHLYRSLISESVLIGLAGSVIGTIFGLAISYYIQEVGIDISSMMQGTNMMMSNVLRSQVTPTAYYLGFMPGLLATVIGSSISGISILKRQTSTLIKELEA